MSSLGFLPVEKLKKYRAACVVIVAAAFLGGITGIALDISLAQLDIVSGWMIRGC